MGAGLGSGETPRRALPERLLLLLAAWTVLVGLSVASAVALERQNTASAAQAALHAAVDRDRSFRLWATSHGGVYVPVTAETPPNPWLAHPHRDVVTTDGQPLTLMNPAYILREMERRFPVEQGTRSRMTSLKPIDPHNTPDAWERRALQAFEAGATEVLERAEVDGQPALRFMVPFRSEPGCRPCHEHQGDAAGDVHGGIGASLPLAPLLAHENQHLVERLSAHGLLWLVGAAGLVLVAKRERRHREAQTQADAALRRSEQNFRHAQAVAHVGSWHLDVASGRLEWSDEAYRIFGVPRGTPLSLERFLARIHPEDRGAVEQAWGAALAGAPYDIEHRVAVDGEVRWVRERAEVELAGGRALRGIGTVEDITARKRLAAEALAAQHAAETANLAKSRFLANMSHEIRTPLNGVLGMAQLLLDPELEHAKRDEYAQTIFHSGQTLLAILNDVLDLAKVESGKVELAKAPFEPAALIHDVVELFAEAARAKGLSLQGRWEGLPGDRLLGDAPRLRQVLSNLVSNAIKFTEAGVVRLTGETLHDTTLRFEVADTGIGIPAEHLDRLFLPFSQVDDSNARRHGGSGLGLVIARNFARLMGGDVGVESVAGRGTTFRVTLQACRVDPRPAGSAANPGPGFLSGGGAIDPGLRVLVVEDVEINRRVVRALLAKAGVASEAVPDGVRAVERLTEAHDFDVVLMDCQMPGLDGFQATRCVRAWEADQAAPRVRIVALTASAFESDRDRCLAAGMDGFLAKPVTLEALVRALAAVRARSRTASA